MPHIIVKLWAGRSDEEKAKIADDVAKALMASMKCREEIVSVGIEDYAPADWANAVYVPDIIDKPQTIYKKPGYDPR